MLWGAGAHARVGVAVVGRVLRVVDRLSGQFLNLLRLLVALFGAEAGMRAARVAVTRLRGYLPRRPGAKACPRRPLHRLRPRSARWHRRTGPCSTSRAPP